MKTYLVYGFIAAVANALLTFAMYLFGFHEAEKLDVGNLIVMPVGLAIGIFCIVLGTKARRAEIGPAEDFSYGRALGAGVMISLLSGLFGLITSGVYFGVINPDLGDVMASAQIAKMEAKGVSGDALEGAEKAMKFMMNPTMLTIMGFFGALMNGLIISLIAAAFLKRKASDLPPSLS
jgi:hypothetical protein